MKIEIRNVKLHAGLSEETPCYTATVFVDGKAFADVENHGHGGSDNVHPAGHKTPGDYGIFRAKLDELEIWIKENHPKHVYEDFVIEENLEGLCHAAAWRSKDETNFKSALSRNVMFTKTADTDDVYQVKAPSAKRAGTIEHIKGKYPEARILNEMPFNKAFDLVHKAA